MAIPAAIMKLAIEGAVTHHAGSIALKGISENMSATPAGRAMKFAAAAAGQGIRADFDDDEVQYMQIDETDLDCQCDCGPCTECEQKRKANAQHDFAKQVRARERPITPSGDITRGVNVNRRIPRAPRSFAEDSSLNVNKTTPRAPRSFAQDSSLRVNKTTPRAPTPFRKREGSGSQGAWADEASYLDELRDHHQRFIGRDHAKEGADEEQGDMSPDNPYEVTREELDCQCPCATCEECEYKEEERDIRMIRPTLQQTHEANLGLIADADGDGSGIGTGDGGVGAGGPGSGAGGNSAGSSGSGSGGGGA